MQNPKERIREIDERLNHEAKVTLLTRPRRFGKTTLLSTVENFFDPRFPDIRSILKNCGYGRMSRHAAVLEWFRCL